MITVSNIFCKGDMILINYYLTRIRRLDTLDKLVAEIQNIYKEFDNEEYIPAILEEGKFTVEEGEDFYLKLILKHHDVKIKTTWLKNNLSYGLSEPRDRDFGAFIHNVIVYRNYKSRNLYQVNPLITNEQVNEYQYDNSMFINAYYNDEYSNLKGKPVLKSNENTKLFVLKDILKDYINDPKGNVYPKYELVAEFEYRTHNNKIKEIESKEYKLNNAYIRVDVTDNSTLVLGSVLVPFNNKILKKPREIQVVDLMTLKIRDHNPKNYTGDRDEGLVYFKKDIIDVIRENYYIYNLQIIDKNEIDNQYLIDILDDKIMFFEGEYNKLPKSIKDKIDSYNFVPSEKIDMISEAMKSWQLEGNWHWEDKLLPNYKLASLIRNKSFSNAIDLSLSFEYPKSKADFRDFITKIEKLTEIKLESFNVQSKDVSTIILIRDGLAEDKLVDLNTAYLKYCYAIYRRYSDDRH